MTKNEAIFTGLKSSDKPTYKLIRGRFRLLGRVAVLSLLTSGSQASSCTDTQQHLISGHHMPNSLPTSSSHLTTVTLMCVMGVSTCARLVAPQQPLDHSDASGTLQLCELRVPVVCSHALAVLQSQVATRRITHVHARTQTIVQASYAHMRPLQQEGARPCCVGALV